MICFFAITIYHNLASHSLLTYCFYNINRISSEKIVKLYPTISTGYAPHFFTSPLGSLDVLLERNSSRLGRIFNLRR